MYIYIHMMLVITKFMHGKLFLFPNVLMVPEYSRNGKKKKKKKKKKEKG